MRRVVDEIRERVKRGKATFICGNLSVLLVDTNMMLLRNMEMDHSDCISDVLPRQYLIGTSALLVKAEAWAPSDCEASERLAVHPRGRSSLCNHTDHVAQPWSEHASPRPRYSYPARRHSNPEVVQQLAHQLHPGPWTWSNERGSCSLGRQTHKQDIPCRHFNYFERRRRDSALACCRPSVISESSRLSSLPSTS